MDKGEIESFLEGKKDKDVKNEQIGTDLLSLRNQADALQNEIDRLATDLSDASQDITEFMFDLQRENQYNEVVDELEPKVNRLSNLIGDLRDLI